MATAGSSSLSTRGRRSSRSPLHLQSSRIMVTAKDVLLLVGGALAGLVATVLLEATFEDWKRQFVRWWWPEPITFEASRVSGCSGGELHRLLPRAKYEGLRFQSEKRVRQTILCSSWAITERPSKVFEAM